MNIERNHAIGAAIAVFIGWLLVTAAVPSLRWIPYAFVAGFLAAIFAIVYLLLTSSIQPEQIQACNPTRALPRFITASAWKAEKEHVQAEARYSRRVVFPGTPGLAARVDGLLDLVIKTFISSWFIHISSKSLFQNAVDKAIRDALDVLRERLLQFDIVDFAVMRIVPVITGHMQEFYTAERLVRGKNLTRDTTESQELDLAIAAKYRDGKLHPAASLAFADTKVIQQAHIRKVVQDILPLVLTDDMQSSPAVLTLIREIVSCAILANVLTMLADPDLWNRIFEDYGRTVLQDRNNVRKLRAALDEHAASSSSSAAKASRRPDVPRLRPHDNERQFERFIRALRKLSTLPDARRYRNEISSQISKVMTSPLHDSLFLRRLDAGRQILDQRIAMLSASDADAVQSPSAFSAHANSTGKAIQLAQMSLQEVMYNASGLSYFMEYMDRRARMRLVQFWIIVDGFRMPLEEEEDEAQPTLQKQKSYHSADRMDIRQIRDTYLNSTVIRVPSSSLQAIDAYIAAGGNADLTSYVKARRAIINIQTASYEDMKINDFESFKRSDLFYKWAASEDVGSSPTQTMRLNVNHTETPRASNLVQPTSPIFQRHISANQIAVTRDPKLRRAIASSTDLPRQSKANSSLTDDLLRRSIDDAASRPIFSDDFDDVDDGRRSRSVPDMAADDSDTEFQQPHDEPNQVVDAMQKELDDIVDGRQHDPTVSDGSTGVPSCNESPSLSQGTFKPGSNSGPKPSIASLGLIAGSSHNKVFTDDLFADEQEQYLEDEREDPEHGDKPLEDEIEEAAPGDLGLAEAITVLNGDIKRLVAQEKIVDSLTKKAELTNHAAELRILRKSKQSLQREIRRREMQKQQYVVQESDNSLYGRAAISIKSILVGREEDGHEYAIYVVEVRRSAGDQMPAASWTVTRRYSEFHDLNKRLKAMFESVRNLEFPRRQTLFTLQRDFLQKRRIALERYIGALLQEPAICRSREFRAFLSQSKIIATNGDGSSSDQSDFVARIYNSVSDGMEEFLGNLPVLDQLTVAGQNLISAASAQINGGGGGGGGGGTNGISGTTISNDVMSSETAPSVAHMADDPQALIEAEAEMEAFEDRDVAATAAAVEPSSSSSSPSFVKPISDLFLETFELQRGNSWLRGRALVVVLHQLLGGTVERKIRDTFRSVTDEASLVRYVDLVTGSLWPGDDAASAAAAATGGDDAGLSPRPIPSVPPRSSAQKAKSRQEAGLVLASLIPDMAGNVVGRANAQAASRKIAALLNNQRLK